MQNPEKISDERKAELVDRFNEPEENYELLREGVQKQKDTASSLDQLDTNGILQRYVTFTDKLIGIADGSITEAPDIVDPRKPERSREKKDEIIFLDKSARPVSWLMDAFWEQLAQKDAEKPHYDFLNIDRVNWFMDQGYRREEAETILGPRDFDIEKVDIEDLARIRAYFVKGDLSEDTWQDEVWNMPTRLDGKNILIVDEVKSQGGTLSIATQLLRKAIPEAIVSGQYFWETSYREVGGFRQADSVPVWYSKEDAMGRGIGDISKQYHDYQYEKQPTQENLRRKIAQRILSAPHFDKRKLTQEGVLELLDDKKAKKLQQDIAFSTYAVGGGTVPLRPSMLRDSDDVIRTIENQGLTVRESTTWAGSSKRITNEVTRRTRNQR